MPIDKPAARAINKACRAATLRLPRDYGLEVDGGAASLAEAGTALGVVTSRFFLRRAKVRAAR